MEETSIVKRLKNVDRELHSIMDELETKRQKKVPSLSELTKSMGKARILNIDSTKLIRKMRDREYDL